MDEKEKHTNQAPDSGDKLPEEGADIQDPMNSERKVNENIDAPKGNAEGDKLPEEE